MRNESIWESGVKEEKKYNTSTFWKYTTYFKSMQH